jgi:hypothetical protein
MRIIIQTPIHVGRIKILNKEEKHEKRKEVACSLLALVMIFGRAPLAQAQPSKMRQVLTLHTQKPLT